MPRITAPDIVNELKINDAISGETITLFYRLPTTDERVRYTKSSIRREGNKIKNEIAETRQKFGKTILVGIKDGDFIKLVDGKEAAYSSDLQSLSYDPNWKELVCTYASDLVEFLALTVFEGNSRDMDIFSSEEEAGENAEKNS